MDSDAIRLQSHRLTRSGGVGANISSSPTRVCLKSWHTSLLRTLSPLAQSTHRTPMILAPLLSASLRGRIEYTRRSEKPEISPRRASRTRSIGSSTPCTSSRHHPYSEKVNGIVSDGSHISPTGPRSSGSGHSTPSSTENSPIFEATRRYALYVLIPSNTALVNAPSLKHWRFCRFTAVVIEGIFVTSRTGPL